MAVQQAVVTAHQARLAEGQPGGEGSDEADNVCKSNAACCTTMAPHTCYMVGWVPVLLTGIIMAFLGTGNTQTVSMT